MLDTEMENGNGFGESEVGIYKRKQESKKKEGKHALNQENDQEKRKFFLFFSWSLSWSRLCFLSFLLFIFLDHFLGRKRVFLFSFKKFYINDIIMIRPS